MSAPTTTAPRYQRPRGAITLSLCGFCFTFSHVPLHVLASFAKGLPVMGDAPNAESVLRDRVDDMTPDEREAIIADHNRRCCALLSAADTQPTIYFASVRDAIADESGCVWWDDLHPVDQRDLVAAIQRYSGTGEGAVRDLATFPAGPEGGGNGALAPETVTGEKGSP